MRERQVSYSDQVLNAANPLARFAHRARYAIGLKLITSLAKNGNAVLDFGCGDGAFLQTLGARRPDLRLFGHDPYSGHVPRGYIRADDLSTVPDGSIDIVCSFETMEHLYPNEIEEFFEILGRLLTTDGVLVVSVPIIGGPILLLKELNRAVMFRRRSDYKFDELIRAALLGIPAARPADIRTSHKGFDSAALRSQLAHELEELRCFFSPFQFAGKAINSQMFWIGKGRHRVGRRDR